MNVKKVSIVFENCESLEYSFPDISYFQIYGPYISFGNYSNAISKNECVNGFTIIISKDAKPEECLFSERPNPNSRLMNDITQLFLTYEDGTTQTYFVKWPHDDDDMYHSKQEVHVSADGHYCITSWSDEFPQEKPNDEEIDLNVYFKAK